MKLTKVEEEMLSGKRGNVIQKAMELLVAVGECYGAERMVPVASAHLPGCGSVVLGEAGVHYINQIAEEGGRFIIPTTTNPSSIDPWAWREMGFSEENHREQTKLSGVIAKMGASLCNTCTPYLIGHAPRKGQHVAWGESSAICYSNAVIGSRTNREGGPTGIAAALTGRAPAYGYHLDENRLGTLKVEVDLELKGDIDYATLGFFTGTIAQDRVPIFIGIPSSVSNFELQCLGAGMATSGSVAHYHVISATPEAPTEEIASGSKRIGPSDTFNFGARDLSETQKGLCEAEPDEANIVILGCPHASIDQIIYYAKALSGRKLRSGVETWILTPHPIKQYAEDEGYADIIESAGAKLVSNTCPTGMAYTYFEEHGYNVVATDSPKMTKGITATQKNVRCYYGSIDTIISALSNKR